MVQVHASCKSRMHFVTHLVLEPGEEPVLAVHLRAHVERHVAEVVDHRAHLAKVLFHLVLLRTFRDPAHVEGSRGGLTLGGGGRGLRMTDTL